MVGLIGRMLAQGTQRLAWQLIESYSPRVQLRHEFLPHLGTPETPDVIGDTADRLLPRLSAKEISDIVRHVYQMLCAAHGCRPLPNTRQSVDVSARQHLGQALIEQRDRLIHVGFI